MAIPLTIADFSGWQNNSRAEAITEFTIGDRGNWTMYDLPFLEWSIQDLNEEGEVGSGEGVQACRYLLTRATSVTQQDILDAPDLHPGGNSGFVRPIGYYAGGVEGVLDEYGDPYAYDYYADGEFRAGCNFEITITEPLEEGIWRLFAIALSKDNEWGPVS